MLKICFTFEFHSTHLLLKTGWRKDALLNEHCRNYIGQDSLTTRFPVFISMFFKCEKLPERGMSCII